MEQSSALDQSPDMEWLRDMPRTRAFLDELTSHLTSSQVDLRAHGMDVRLADLIERLGDRVATLEESQILLDNVAAVPEPQDT